LPGVDAPFSLSRPPGHLPPTLRLCPPSLPSVPHPRGATPRSTFCFFPGRVRRLSCSDHPCLYDVGDLQKFPPNGRPIDISWTVVAKQVFARPANGGPNGVLRVTFRVSRPRAKLDHVLTEPFPMSAPMEGRWQAELDRAAGFFPSRPDNLADHAPSLLPASSDWRRRFQLNRNSRSFPSIRDGSPAPFVPRSPSTSHRPSSCVQPLLRRFAGTSNLRKV